MISTGVVICDNNNHPVNPYDREIIMKTPTDVCGKKLEIFGTRPYRNRKKLLDWRK